MPRREIQAQGPWVLIDPIAPAKKTEGGLYRPEGNMEDRLGYSQGIVLSVGKGKVKDTKNGRFHEHSGLEVGDRVLFRGHLKDANRPMPLDDHRCLLHQDDLLGKFED